MAGRNAQPLALVRSNGRKHLTKDEIEHRQKSEIKLKNKTLHASDAVLKCPRALQEFKRLKKLYKEIEFVGSLDEHLINQYCMAVWELDVMTELMDNAMKVIRDEERTISEKLIAQKQVLEIGSELRLKRQQVVTLGDRLYLNPVSRTKNIPRKEPRKPRDEHADMFD